MNPKLFRVFSVFRGLNLSLHRIRPQSSDFCSLIAALCLLSTVFCSPAWAGGSWLVNGQAVQSLEVQTSNADTNALYTDGSRTMQAPLVFDSAVSSEVSGLFKATVPWDAEYDFFTFNPTRETVVLSPTLSSLGFEAGNLILHGYGTIRSKGDSSTYISFEEHFLAGGGWFISSVENDGEAILNRSYADARYIQRSVGITTNHTIQAGDVLQIQNGIITAINP